MASQDNFFLESERFTFFRRTCVRCRSTWDDAATWRRETTREDEEEVRVLHQYDKSRREHKILNVGVRVRTHINCGGRMYEPTVRELNA